MKPMTYKKAGVDIDKAAKLVKKITSLARTGRSKGVVAGIGGFGGLFEIPKGYKQPILAASSDGVGTKLKLAGLLHKHDTVGIDLVAMNVNDILATGARPLFFLDYIATGKIESNVLADVIKGIVRGCRQADSVLLGGETAEMPGFYQKGEYELAGFSLGVVEKKMIITGKTIKAGDLLIGLASSGVHSNGFSLVRKIFSKKELQGKLGKELLKPTRIYVKPVLPLRKKIKGIAHITGGGFIDNIPRILPKGLIPLVYKGTWPIPEIFKKIQQAAKINDFEMFRTFNMGVGMVLVVKKKDAPSVIRHMSSQRLPSWVIGEVARA